MLFRMGATGTSPGREGLAFGDEDDGGRPTRVAQGWINDVRLACEQASKDHNLHIHFMDTWIPGRASLRDAITNPKYAIGT